MTYWTEEAIALHLEGKFYQLQQMSLGKFAVVDLNEPEEDEEEPLRQQSVEKAPVTVIHAPRVDGRLWLGDIARVVCEVYAVSKLEFQSIRRNTRLVAARQVFFWIAKKYTSHSFPLIGSWCGRDHTTVMHGVSKIDARLGDYLPQIEVCLSRLGVSLQQEEAA